MLPQRVGSISVGGGIPQLSISRARIRQPRLQFSPALQQMTLMLIVLAVTDLLASVGLGAVARIFFVTTGLAASAFYIRRSPWQYITLTCWFWTLTALARRLIDYHAGFDPVNYVLGTPNLMALFMLKDVLGSRQLLRQRESLIGLFPLIAILYGLAVNLVQGDIVPAITAIADWISPLIYYFYVIANSHKIQDAEASFSGFISLNALIMVAYGIPQFFGPLPWDVEWVKASGMLSIGTPEAYNLRVFGTMNAPGALAPWLVTLLLLSIHFRTRISTLLFAPTLGLLLMTLVRSSTGTLVLGLLIAGFMGRKAIFKFIGIAVVAAAFILGGVSAVDPQLTDLLTKRFETVGDLSNDPSAAAREEIYRQTPAMIAKYPFGLGIGALGRGAVTSQDAELVVVDSGPLAIFISLGWVGGFLYFTGIVLVMAQALLAARGTRSGAAVAAAAAAVATAALIPGANVVGFSAAMMWLCAAYAAAMAINAREQRALKIS